MKNKRPHLTPEDIAVGLDLGSQKHQVVILSSDGERLTRFCIPHSREGFAELVRRADPKRWSRGKGKAVFAFEATGHFWEALAHFLTERGLSYALVNPLATFRVREARQMDRDKRDVTDAEQVADLLRTGMVTEGQLESRKYMKLRRAWDEFDRLRRERARLKTLAKHQLYGVFPELVTVWKDLFAPGPLAVLRLGLTPTEIASFPFSAFWARVREQRRGRRLWRYKVRQVYERAARSVSPPHGAREMMDEIQRLAARVDLLSDQLEALGATIRSMLGEFEEAAPLATMPGIDWVTISGLIAQIGSIDKYRHGRQLIKLAGTHPSRRESGAQAGRTAMTRRGRADLRTVVYLATVSCIQHNPRIKAHYERLLQRRERPLCKMQALGACMNKFLLYAFAVMKKRQTFAIDHCWEAEQERLAA